jgi:hypothetical protein
MKKVFLLCFSLCAAAFSAGCGVQASSSTSNPDTLEAYIKVDNQLTCEARERCCGTTCGTGTDSTFYKNATRTLEFVSQGLLRYDAAAAAECLAFRSQYYSVCDKPVIQLPKAPANCDKVIVPNTPAGGMCDNSIGNCVPETVCTAGTCIALPPVGQPCATTGQQCVSTGYCEVATSTCRALPTGGQSCAMSGFSCAKGFYCDSVSRLCTANGQSGQACSGAKPCDTTANLICLSNSTCGLPQPDGAPCTSATHCQSGRCSGLVAGSTCQPQLVPTTLRQQFCGLR